MLALLSLALIIMLTLWDALFCIIKLVADVKARGASHAAGGIAAILGWLVLLMLALPTAWQALLSV